MLGSVVKPTPTPIPPEVDEAAAHWLAIQRARKIVVGTSADYVPFADYDTNFVISGFDIDLMHEVGRRLGLAVEFCDFVFEGLLGALQLNQFDAAMRL